MYGSSISMAILWGPGGRSSVVKEQTEIVLVLMCHCWSLHIPEVIFYKVPVFLCLAKSNTLTDVFLNVRFI